MSFLPKTEILHTDLGPGRCLQRKAVPLAVALGQLAGQAEATVAVVAASCWAPSLSPGTAVWLPLAYSRAVFEDSNGLLRCAVSQRKICCFSELQDLSCMAMFRIQQDRRLKVA